MKYLKKFNEELKSSTYKRAADQLKRLGHKRRSNELENWSKEVEIREEDRKVKKLISKLSPIGTFKMDILDGKNEIIFNSEFYVILYFNSDLFIDMYNDYVRYPENRNDDLSFSFDICLVPANDDEESLEFKQTFKKSSWLGSYYISSFYIFGNNYDIIPIDEDDSLFSNRKEAFKFKKEFIKSLIEEEHPWDLKKQVLKVQNKIDSINKEVGVTTMPDGTPVPAIESFNIMDMLLNSAKKISLNKLYID